MSVTTPCREGVTRETISAWGDGGLSATEAARLAAHASGCPACRETLNAYRDIDRLLSGQRIPAAPPVDIAAILRAGQPATRVRAGANARLPRAVWGGIGAVVAAALLIAAFSQVFARLAHPSPTATVTPAVTATPATSALNWSERTIPPGLTLTEGGLAYAFSPTNDQDGWICAQASDGSFTIWATTDQARSWHVASHLTQTVTNQPVFSCGLTPDSVNPRVLALSFGWGCGACGTLSSASYISSDGGATWRQMPSNTGVGSLATIGGRTFALSGNAVSVSNDSLVSWHAAGPNVPANTTFFYLWPDPTTGALLLSDGSNVLWLTRDLGVTWREITLPAGFQIGMGEGSWLPATGGWRICGQVAGDNPSSSPIQCTTDLGKTWTSQPYLAPIVTCSNCNKDGGPLVNQQGCYPLAMAPDGSMYTYCEVSGTVTQGQTGVWNLYRLAPGATVWVSLGQPPSSVAHPFPTPLPGAPVDGPSQIVGAVIFTGGISAHGETVWYSDPLLGILTVASLPS